VLVAVARRAAMPGSLAGSLAELGGPEVAEALVDNGAAPMTERVAGTLVDRFQTAAQVMDKLALRGDLVAEIAVRLTAKLSAAARAKLIERYQLPDHTEAAGAEAELAAMLAVVRQTAPASMPALVHALKRDSKLTDFLLLKAAAENLIEFLAVALADRAMLRLEQVRTVLNQAGTRSIVELLRAAGVAAALHDAFWTALSRARSKKEWTIH